MSGAILPMLVSRVAPFQQGGQQGARDAGQAVGQPVVAPGVAQVLAQPADQPGGVVAAKTRRGIKCFRPVNGAPEPNSSGAAP
ncbi:MAG TPA: hypothetical protein ENN99_06110 [Chloroflexi bacterium]|nr:hypothetical protein [Chloroflexota bacterium]